MIRLQEQHHTLREAPEATFGSQLHHFVKWLEAEAFFAAILESLPLPSLKADVWVDENVKGRHNVQFSPEPTEAASERWQVLHYVVSQESVGRATFEIASDLIYGRNVTIDDCNHLFTDVFVSPLVACLKEKILTDDLLLHSLDRYAREVSWFRRNEVRNTYEGDTRRGEETLDQDLRHHLFRDGIDFPYSQTHTPSGRPDIVVADEDTPIPLEVKVYDPARSRDTDALRKGFAQAIEYAHDYRRADAYLAVFDVSENGLAIESDDPSGHLPVIRGAGVSVFVIVIPIAVAKPASSRGKANRKTLDGEFFRRG